MHTALRVIGLCGMLLAANVSAQDSVGVSCIGRIFHDWDNAVGIALDGNLTVVATQLSGVHFLDCSVPEQPVQIGTCRGNASSEAVVVRDEFAYVAAGPDGLAIYDYSEPRRPTAVSMLPLRGRAWDIVLNGDLAYLALDVEGIAVVDVANPAEPELLMVLDTVGSIRKIALAEDYLVVAADTAGVMILDIRNPRRPEVVSITFVPGQTRAVAVDGRIAYLGAHSRGLQVLDFSNPIAPQVVGSLATPDNAIGMAYDEGRAYICARSSGLRIADVTDPRNPMLLGIFDSPGNARDVVIREGAAYLADLSAGFRIVDVTNPAQTRVIGFYDTPDYILNPKFSSAVLSGFFLVVTKGEAGMGIIQLAGQQPPLNLGNYNSPGRALDVFTSGTTAYMADDSAGLRVVSFANPASPRSVGSYGQTQAVQVKYAGELGAMAAPYMLVASPAAGVQFFDVSAPESPQLVLTVDELGGTRSLAVFRMGNSCRVYWAAGERGLATMTISDPRQPDQVQVRTFDLGGPVYNVASGGEVDRVYAAVDGSGIAILAIDREESLLGFIELTGPVHKMAQRGDHLHVANGEDGYRLFDLSAPDAPNEVGYYDFDAEFSPCLGFTLLADNVVAVVDTGSIRILDVAEAMRVEQNAHPVPKDHLFAIYPNPFNAALTISYEGLQAKPTRIGIYNLSGRLIREWDVEGNLGVAGRRLTWDAADAANGTYWVWMESSQGIALKKVVLLK